MEDYSEHIAIVFPAEINAELGFVPEDAPEPHCTLIYLGKVNDASYTKEDVQAVLDRVRIKDPGEISTDDLAMFGPEKDVLVVQLNSDKLDEYRNTVERALAKIGARNASSYKDFNPHITLDSKAIIDLEKAGEVVDLPKTVKLSAPVLWWGEDR